MKLLRVYAEGMQLHVRWTGVIRKILSEAVIQKSNHGFGQDLQGKCEYTLFSILVPFDKQQQQNSHSLLMANI
jgi:hypothetical protein